jgi:hypothetical protein
MHRRTAATPPILQAAEKTQTRRVRVAGDLIGYIPKLAIDRAARAEVTMVAAIPAGKAGVFAAAPAGTTTCIRNDESRLPRSQCQ